MQVIIRCSDHVKVRIYSSQPVVQPTVRCKHHRLSVSTQTDCGTVLRVGQLTQQHERVDHRSRYLVTTTRAAWSNHTNVRRIIVTQNSTSHRSEPTIFDTRCSSDWLHTASWRRLLICNFCRRTNHPASSQLRYPLINILSRSAATHRLDSLSIFTLSEHVLLECNTVFTLFCRSYNRLDTIRDAILTCARKPT